MRQSFSLCVRFVLYSLLQTKQRIHWWLLENILLNHCLVFKEEYENLTTISAMFFP